jgi:hypothetical protein
MNLDESLVSTWSLELLRALMNQAAPAASNGDDDTMSARYYRSPVATRGICSMLLFTWLLEVSRLLLLPCLSRVYECVYALSGCVGCCPAHLSMARG